MSVNTNADIIFFGARNNVKQQILGIAAKAEANLPGLLFMQDVDDSGNVGDHWLWFDSSDELRVKHGTIPVDQNDGDAIGSGTGASKALDDLAAVQINATLKFDTDDTYDVGESGTQIQDIFVDGIAYIDECRGDVGKFGDDGLTHYISIAATGILTMEGNATIDGIGSGNLVDKSATEVITGGWDITTVDLDIKADNIKITWGAGGDTDSYQYFSGTKLMFYDSDVGSEVSLAQLQAGTPLSPVVNGDFSIPNGTFNWTDSTDETAATWSFSNTGGTADIDITSSATTGQVINITADSLANGTALFIDSSGGPGASGYFIAMKNGSAIEASFGQDGAMTLASTGDVEHKISRDNATGTNPLLEIEETNVSGGVAFLVDSKHTGAVDAVQITYAGTENALDIVTTHVNSSSIVCEGVASQVAPMVLIDAGAGPFIGASGVGALEVICDGALADADTNLIRVEHSGDAAGTAINGSCLALIDTGAASGESFVSYLSSTYNNGLQIITGATGNKNLVLSGVAAQVDNIIYVDGSTGSGWVGASTVGMVDLETDGTLAAGANLLRIDSSGTNEAASFVAEIICSGNVVGSTDGTALRVIDSGNVAGTSSAVYIDSTANDGMEIQTTAVAATNLILTGSASQIASMLSVDGTAGAGWDGASGVGMVNIAADGAHIDVNASLLNITDGTGAMIGAARGSCLRIIDTTTAGADAWVAYIDTTANDGLLITTGAVSDINLKLTGVEEQTNSMAYVDGSTGTGWDGADVTGMLHLKAQDMVHTGATALYVDIAAQPISSGAGVAARFVQSTGSARTDAYLVEIAAVSTGGGLHVSGGFSTFTEKATFTAGAQSAAVARVADVSENGGDSVIAAGTAWVEVTSSTQTKYISLPTPTPGFIVWINVGSNGYSLKAGASQTVYLNGGKGTTEDDAAVTVGADVLVRAMCIDSTHWLATQFSATGVESTLGAASST